MPVPSPVTPGENRIRLLYRMRARQRFWRMMTRHGIDPLGHWWHGAEGMIARATATCAACANAAICGAWLDEVDTPVALVPAFCPNGRVIEAARIMDPYAACDTTDASNPGPVSEPSLAELLADPLVTLMMNADRVNGEVLRHAMTDAPRFAAAFAAPNLGLRPR